MDANSVTINELITQMINEARRLGFGETTIWRNWVHKAGMVTMYYRDHGVCLCDPAVTDAFVQETRQRYDAGAISKSHLKQIRQIAGRLNEFYVTGTLRIDTTMRGTRYELSSRYEHLVDLFITHQGYKDRYSNLINRFNEHMNAYVQSANNAICTFVQENNGERSGSTMALLCISPEKKEAVASNVGDSKVFLFRKNELKKISEDHRDIQSGRRIVRGINCNGENAFREFMTTKAAYDKMEGTYYYHYVQSFSYKEGITHDKAHEIAREFAAEAWPGHEILVATHLDTKNPHSHFVINSVSFENGYNLRQDTHTLEHLREKSDRICMSHGYSIIKILKSVQAISPMENIEQHNEVTVGKQY